MTGARRDADAAWVGALVGETLGVEPPLADADLFALDGFDSLAIVALVEALERTLGCELPEDLLVPETFATTRALAAAVSAIPAGLGGPAR